MIQRNRLISLAAMIVVVLLGIGSRRYGDHLPEFIAEYAGDTLWALLVFLLVGFLAPRWSTWRVATAALLFSFAIEASQLYHAPWIDSLRHTTPGALVLGFSFLWTDLVCYTAGVAIGILLPLSYSKGGRGVCPDGSTECGVWNAGLEDPTHRTSNASNTR